MLQNRSTIHVVGAGLAGSECALQLAGQALGIDRNIFASLITQKLKSHPLVQIRHQVVNDLNEIPRPCVLATGPLTDESLAHSLQRHFGEEFLYFFDAIAPVIDADSINTEIAWRQDRYDKGSADYLNCPLNKEQYFSFIEAVKAARKIEPKHFETTSFFEGCMPIETMIERGPHTLRFGPMKPVGLKPPGAEREAYAVVQLRQENTEASAYNMVGFQTRMAYGEQSRVFRLIPGLENAEFLKLGSMHRNLFVNSPTLLNKDLSSRFDPWLFLAGQITGVEGYFESTCTGLMVAHFLHHKLQSRSLITDDRAFPPRSSALGSLLNAITNESRAKHFQPTNINFSLLPTPADTQENFDANGRKLKFDKNLRRAQQILRAKSSLHSWLNP